MNKTIEEIIAEGGVECELCGQRMLRVDGCNCSEIECDGKVYKRIPYGEYEYDTDERCHDCNASNGNYHHYGCDMERCPVCGGQLIGCDCNLEFIDCQ